MNDVIASLGVVDFVLIAFIVWGALTGFARGFANQLVKLTIFVIALVVAFELYPNISKAVVGNSRIQEVYVQFLAICILFFIVRLFMKVCFFLIARLATLQFSYVVERVGGSITGIVRYVLIFSLCSHLMLMLPLPLVNKFYHEYSLTGNVIALVASRVHAYCVVAGKALVGMTVTANKEAASAARKEPQTP